MSHVKNIKQQLPMWITWMRIFAVPFILVLLQQNTEASRWWAVVLFILAAISDWADGYFARIWNAATTMGKFLDPIADKVLVSSLLVFLVAKQVIDPYMVIILLTRDTLIGGIRSAAASDGIIIAAKSLGKWKTAIQMVCLPLAMVDFPIGPFSSLQVALAGLWISVFLSVFSGFDYFFGYYSGRKKTANKT